MSDKQHLIKVRTVQNNHGGVRETKTHYYPVRHTHQPAHRGYVGGRRARRREQRNLREILREICEKSSSAVEDVIYSEHETVFSLAE